MKKLLSIVLAVVMAVGLSTVAFAADDRITGAIKPIDTYYAPDLDSVSPGAKVVYPLTADMFEWSSGTAGVAKAPVTRAQISRASVKPIISGNSTAAIKNVTIGYQSSSVTGNQTTAVITVEFVNPFISTSSRSFDANMFLQIKNRQPDSRMSLVGNIENKVVTVDSGDRYADLAGGRILEARGSIRNLDIDLGKGISMLTNVYSGQKYYAYASNDITSSDDKVLSKYPSITDIVRIETIGLNKTGKYVDFSQFGSGYVYGSDGKFLGNSSSLLAFSKVYYISSRDLGGSITSGGGGTTTPDPDTSNESSTSSSSTSSGSGSTGSGGSVTLTSVLTRSDVVGPTKTAAQKAKAAGAKTALVTARNDAAITADALKAMASTAKEYGVGAQLNANTVVDKVVVGRVSINAASAAKLTADTKLGAHLNNGNAKKAKSMFSSSFKNKIAVVSLDQNDTFGMAVSIAAKVNLSNLNKNNLYFYSYNRSSNKYYRIATPNAWVDSNGYLRFTTTLAGDVIISDGALTK